MSWWRIFGNFVNRALVLTQKYYDGKVLWANSPTTTNKRWTNWINVKADVEKLLKFSLPRCTKEAMNLARIGNKYLADTEPGRLPKPTWRACDTIMHLSLQIAANLAIAFEPFLPFSSEKLRNMLGLKTFDWKELSRIDLLKAGDQLGTPELLFEKIEDETIAAQVQKLQDTKLANEAAAYKPEAVKENVAFDDFMKVDIRVATVLDSRKCLKADKLLQFKLDDGMGGRTILSGISYYPNPEELDWYTGLLYCQLRTTQTARYYERRYDSIRRRCRWKISACAPGAVVTNGVE